MSLLKGFGFSSSWDPIKDTPDLTGKIALVTGGKLVGVPSDGL
jgi:hypothetical protein